jgi:hypothetical protein
MAHIFVCYSSKDQAIADDVVTFLEARHLKCWISSRDVPPGQNYQEVIVGALENAHGIVFLFSENSRESGEIKKELSLAGSLNAPVFPLRLSAITPSGALRYELATRQWIDMFPDAELALGKLLASIRHMLAAPAQRQAIERTAAESAPTAAELVQLAPMPASSAPPKPVVSAGSPEFEAIRVLLARHIGPIAKVLMQKAATDARSAEEFCDRIAAHVSAPTDRIAFLQAARAQLSVKS